MTLRQFVLTDIPYVDVINIHKSALYWNNRQSIYLDLQTPIHKKITKNDIIIIKHGISFYIEESDLNKANEFNILDNCISGFLKNEGDLMLIKSLSVYNRFDKNIVEKYNELSNKIKELINDRSK